MKGLTVITGFALLLLCAKSHAQSATVTPSTDSGRASQASCVILKRIGRIGRTESRLTHFGISGKQFRYVEGKLPEGFSLHHKMTEHDVSKLQARGAQVLVLESHYTSEDLQEARADCQRGPGKTPNQVEAKASPPQVPQPVASASAPAAKPPAPAAGTVVSTSEPAPKPPQANVPSPNKAPSARVSVYKAEDSASSADTTVAALIDVSSTPSGADLYIDEHFFGHTPATTIILTPGNHKIEVKKSGFVLWQKKLKLPSGPTNVNADLLPKSR